MITIRKSEERGHANHGWLDSYHTFSFAGYHDPRHMGFRSLRVINEDRVLGGEGFGTHPHNDMEIVSYVLSGKLAHKDSMGSGSALEPGDVQVMSAGTGVTHSEFNGDQQERVHFLQIWLLPDKRGYQPRYQEKHFSADNKRDKLCLIASPEGADGSLQIRQDAVVYASILSAGKTLNHALKDGRHAWLQVVRGELKLGDTTLKAGDGAAVSGESGVQLHANAETELLLFDLA